MGEKNNRDNLIHWFFFSLTIVFLTTCDLSAIRSNLEKDIIETYNSCSNDTCSYSFKKIFGENWDVIYFLPGLFQASDIEQTIGFKYNGSGVGEDNIRIVVIKNNKIVRSEEFNTWKFKIKNLSDIREVKAQELLTIQKKISKKGEEVGYFLKK